MASCARPEDLRPADCGRKREAVAVVDGDDSYSLNRKSWGHYILWFFIIGLFVYIILYFAKPVSLQTKDANGIPTGLVDNGKTIAVAAIVAIFLIIIFCLAARY